MLSDLPPLLLILERAHAPEDVYGQLAGKDEADKLASLRHAYRHSVSVVHPDVLSSAGATEEEMKNAHEATKALHEWRAKAEKKIHAGTYGDGKSVDLPSASRSAAQVVRSPTGVRYLVDELLAKGDIADVYRCTYTKDGDEKKAVFKLTRSPLDNDLAEKGARTLCKMYPAAQAEEKFFRYLPKPVEAFLLKQRGSGLRRAIVMQEAEDHFSLAEVMAAYPKGLDFRDTVWMFKRSLAGLWHVHHVLGIVHGAVLPPHLLVHPTGHGAKIVGWSAAVEWRAGKERVSNAVKHYRSFYAPEILSKEPPGPQADIYMLGQCVVALLGGSPQTGLPAPSSPAAKSFHQFVSTLLATKPSSRPTDAGALHEDLDELLFKIIGKKNYRPLGMPPRATP